MKFDTEKFGEWIVENGGEILAPTNPYELVRFNAQGFVNVIYASKKKGINFSSQSTTKFYQAYVDGKTKKLAHRSSKYKKARLDIKRLIERDGSDCFFCGKAFTELEPATIEHLVARSHGGPNHMSNYALAHQKCNQKVGRLSLMEKISFRQKMQDKLEINT